MAKYRCSQCGLAVVVVGEEKIFACKCNKPVIALAEAVARGKGGLQQD